MKKTKKEALRFLSHFALSQISTLSAEELSCIFEGFYDTKSSVPSGIKFWVNAFNKNLKKCEETDYRAELIKFKELRAHVLKQSKKWSLLSKQELLRMRTVL